MEFLDYIPVVGFVQGIFLGFILFSLKNGNKKANRVLAVLILSFSLTISKPLFPVVHKGLVLLIFLFGPLLFLYVMLLTKPGYHLKGRSLFHFLPFLVGMTLWLLHFLVRQDSFYDLVIKPLYVLKNIHAAGYCIYIIIYIKKFKNSLKDSYSNLDKINLSWIVSLLVLFILYFCLISTAVLVLLLLKIEWILELEAKGSPILVSVYIFFIGFNGIRHHQVFIDQRPQTHRPVRRHASDQPCSPPEKNKKIELKAEVCDRLLQFLKEEKPFLLDDLTLGKLSELSGIPDYYLSRIINEKVKLNFYDFINSYRIEYFNQICLLAENEKKSLLELALESGFYSKSTFNLSYKKQMGMTPSLYRKTYKKT